MSNNTGPSGRSPYAPPSRSNRRRLSAEHPPDADHSSTSPMFMSGHGLLRVSPHSAAAWSPAVGTNPSARRPRRFFDNPPGSVDLQPPRKEVVPASSINEHGNNANTNTNDNDNDATEGGGATSTPMMMMGGGTALREVRLPAAAMAPAPGSAAGSAARRQPSTAVPTTTAAAGSMAAAAYETLSHRIVSATKRIDFGYRRR